MPRESTDGEQSLPMLTRRSALTATVGGLFATPLIATTIEAQQNTPQSVFRVDIVNNTIPAGGSRQLNLRVTNNLNERVTDIEGKFFADDPLDSTNDETFTGSLKPGETTTVTVDLSASGGATIKSYPASIDFRYVDSEGDSKLTDSYRMVISVIEPNNSAGSLLSDSTLMAAVGGTVVGPVFGYGLYRLITHSRDGTGSVEHTSSDTNASSTTTKSETTQSGKDSPTPVEEHRLAAENAIETAVTARSNDNLSVAADAYSEALNEYDAALEELAAGATDQRTEIEQAVESTRADLEAVKTRREQQNEVIDDLQPAERSFQEAIVAYIQDDQTVARIRFRQARDTFEDAHETITDSEEDMLSDPIEVTVQPDRVPPSPAISELPVIPEPAATALADAGIETVDELDHNDQSPWTPAAVGELLANEAIEEDTATALTLVSWWHSDESYTFETAEVIERRQQQASYAFNHTS